MHRIIKDKIIIISGILLLIIWIAVANTTFNRTFIPIRNYTQKNSKVVLDVDLINDDLLETNNLMKEIIFYETYKPKNYKKHPEKYLNRLTDAVNKTDSGYKKLLSLLSPEAKNFSVSEAQYFDKYIKKSYYHWNYVSKPIIKQFIKYSNFVPLKISARLFFLHSINSSIMPTSKFMGKISGGVAQLVSFAALVFIFGTIVIIILGISVIYYLNIFFREIKQNERRFRSLFNDNPVISLIMDIETGNITDANKAAKKFYGYTKEELVSMNITDIALTDKNESKQLRLDVKDSGGPATKICNHKLKNDDIRRVESTISKIEIGGKEYLIDSIQDITDKVLYESSLRESAMGTEKERDALQTIMNNVPSIIGIYGEKISYMNPYGLQMLGYNERDILGLSPLDLVDIRDEERKAISGNIKRRLTGEYFEEKYTLKIKKKNGETFWGEILTTTIFSKNEWAGLVLIADVNERVINELKLSKEKDIFRGLSELDDLTQIPNRRSFDENIANCLTDKIPNGKKFSLIMFDIDLFKNINDTLGHQTGDTVLKDIALLIKENTRKEDFFARFGGEEFMIIVPDADIEKAAEIAEKLRLSIETHNFLPEIKVTCSFGVTSCKAGDTTDNIIYRVDAALYKAKANGRNRVKTFV